MIFLLLSGDLIVYMIIAVIITSVLHGNHKSPDITVTGLSGSVLV